MMPSRNACSSSMTGNISSSLASTRAEGTCPAPCAGTRLSGRVQGTWECARACEYAWVRGGRARRCIGVRPCLGWVQGVSTISS